MTDFTEILFAPQAEIEKAFQRGFEAGRKEGYAAGFDDGQVEGYADGYQDGRSETCECQLTSPGA